MAEASFYPVEKYLEYKPKIQKEAMQEKTKSFNTKSKALMCEYQNSWRVTNDGQKERVINQTNKQKTEKSLQ